jgi:2-polyprenyl-3-methyl-5-hydroxy-6-metoxy-1,4-benzoquinol methylase
MNTSHSDDAANAQKEYAGLEYFSQLYGSKNDNGEPQQTKLDKLRDRFLVRLYIKYGAVPLAESRVLDVGCGYGWLLENFVGAAKLVGIDISHHAVEIATARNPDLLFKQGNLEQPIDLQETFDLVLANNVIEHLQNPVSGINSISAVCHTNSIVLVHLPTISNSLTRWEYKKLYDSDPTHIYRPSGKQIRELFESNGFTTIRDSFLPHYPAWLTKLYPIHPAYLAVFRKQ